jgi:hypothetical protein
MSVFQKLLTLLPRQVPSADPLERSLVRFARIVKKKSEEVTIRDLQTKDDRQKLERLLATPAFELLKQVGLELKVKTHPGGVELGAPQTTYIVMTWPEFYLKCGPITELGVAVTGDKFELGHAHYYGSSYCPTWRFFRIEGTKATNDPEKIASYLLDFYSNMIDANAVQDVKSRLKVPGLGAVANA